MEVCNQDILSDCNGIRGSDIIHDPSNSFVDVNVISE